MGVMSCGACGPGVEKLCCGAGAVAAGAAHCGAGVAVCCCAGAYVCAGAAKDGCEGWLK